MRIYKMTATFGKLEHSTLELQPGLNIVEAPNEWGKSTWCAFLMVMFYGLDTRAKTTKTALAEKLKYTPWSGSPMAGRIDLNWNGRDITIERTTSGRTPLGNFRAYETESGLAVPELTAANCGAQLLGVEQSVFRRAGFIRQADMPVTQDEALRRRLNDLVTTGDETGDADCLAKELKELKNKCRYNRTGLLPQAEAERKALEDALAEQESLENHCRSLKQRLGETKSWLRELENHQMALDYHEAEQDARRVAEARDARDRAEQNLNALDTACSRLPAKEETEQKIQEVRQFQSQWDMLQSKLQQLPDRTDPPVPPKPFGHQAEENEAMLAADIARYEQLRSTKPWFAWILAAVVCLAAGIVFAVIGKMGALIAVVAAGLLLLAFGTRKKQTASVKAAALEEKYGTKDPADWKQMWESYRISVLEYNAIHKGIQEEEDRLHAQMRILEKQRQGLCGDQTPQTVLENCQKALWCWQQRQDAVREQQQQEKHLQDLQAMAKTAPCPAMEDAMTYNRTDTQHLIRDSREEQHRLADRLGQYRGRIEALGNPEDLQEKLQAVQQRIEKLEQIYRAATLGLETLTRAQQELQRRFAPRISKRAQELLSEMTAGRYDRLMLEEDLSVMAGAAQEDVLREALWRSDGTMDQLYFALRLAVAEELTPCAPLILDDAFVRFDDTRLAAALHILQQQAEQKQVILFTCQSRENQMV